MDNPNIRQELTGNGDGQVRRLSIDLLVTNPKNFYGLRDIDQLAGMITVSHIVEPLIVRPLEDGKYKLIAGHRRLAAWKMLLEKGEETDRTLPCIVKEFQPITYRDEKGSEKTIAPDQQEFYYLMLSNMGQRKNRTIDEQLQEIAGLEPLARAVYATARSDGYEGNFRGFFAKEMLDMSSSALQRKQSLAKLIPEARQAIDDGVITETLAAGMAQMTQDEQRKYLKAIQDGTVSGKVDDLRNALRNKDEESTEPEEPAGDEDTSEDPEDGPEASGTAEDTHPGEEEESPEEQDVPEDDEEPGSKEDTEEYAEPYQPAGELLPDKITISLTDIPIPKTIGNPEQEGQVWYANSVAPVIEKLVEDAEAKQERAEQDGDDMAASQWNVRLAVARVRLLALQHPEAGVQ